MTEGTDLIQPKDLKKPSKAIEKVGNLLVSTMGTITQEIVHSKLSTLMNPNVASGVEYAIGVLGAGMSPNKYLDSFLYGMAGGAAKDVATMALEKIGVTKALKGVTDKLPIGKSDVTNQVVTNVETEDYTAFV